jgi:hypothetical protein
VALLLAAILLGDRLTMAQWVGVGFLGISMLMVRQEDLKARGFNPNALLVSTMASVQFQRIAFHRAFGTSDLDDEHNTMATVTTMEMQAIRDMMGVQDKPVDPLPIIRAKDGLEERDAGGLSVDLAAFLANFDEDGNPINPDDDNPFDSPDAEPPSSG